MKYFIKKRELVSDECKNFKDFLHEEDGMGTVEVILIIVDNPFTSSTYILSY